MESPQQNLISKTGQVCKTLLELMDDIERIDILYSGSPNWNELITDETIAEVDSFVACGLTAQDVADAVWIIKQVRVQINANLPPLVVMAELP
jgi:hypothetical protein